MKISQPQNINFNSINTIIFDWGGVIVNLTPQHTVEAFQNMGYPLAGNDFKNLSDHIEFRNLELGKITTSNFYKAVKKECKSSVNNNDIKNALCTILSDTPTIRIDILKHLKMHFNLYLLSNTNQIHTEYYLDYLQRTHHVNFPSLFNNVYYSHQLGMLKPNPEIFKTVLEKNDLLPETTLFLDDSLLNIDAASELGIQCFHVTGQYPIERIFKKYIAQ